MSNASESGQRSVIERISKVTVSDAGSGSSNVLACVLYPDGVLENVLLPPDIEPGVLMAELGVDPVFAAAPLSVMEVYEDGDEEWLEMTYCRSRVNVYLASVNAPLLDSNPQACKVWKHLSKRGDVPIDVAGPMVIQAVKADGGGNSYYVNVDSGRIARMLEDFAAI